MAHSMLSSCKNVNIPEIINAVEREQEASAGAARTTRRWVHEIREPKSMMDLALPAEHDYNYLIAFCKAFETLNPGSIAKFYITEVNDQEHFDGFCLCFRPQMLRIVRANIRVFTLDACFIKHEKSKLKGWALYTLYNLFENQLTTFWWWWVWARGRAPCWSPSAA